jgi:hypothetical protein
MPSNSYDRFQSPPPLPPAVVGPGGSAALISADRRRVSTETSASAGWAARLALLFPDKGNPAAKPATPSPARPAPAPRPPARRFSACS